MNTENIEHPRRRHLGATTEDMEALVEGQPIKERVRRNRIASGKVTVLLGKAGRIAPWVAKIALALVFVATGTSKILGVQQLVDGFAQIGLGQWFRYFTGAIEISGALLLLWPLTSGLGALILLGVSVGACFVQLFIMHGDIVHTLVLAAVSGSFVWANRGISRGWYLRAAAQQSQ
jgi:putative oxidoreductase